jgi:hypothetical protein
MRNTFIQQIHTDLLKYPIFGHQPFSGSSIRPISNQHPIDQIDYTAIPVWFFSNAGINTHQVDHFHEIPEILLIDLAFKIAKARLNIESVQVSDLWEGNSFENWIHKNAIDSIHEEYAKQQKKNPKVYRIELNNHILYIINAESVLFQSWLLNQISRMNISFYWALYLGAIGLSFISTMEMHEYIIPKMILENTNPPTLVIDDYQFSRIHHSRIEKRYSTIQLLEVKSQHTLIMLKDESTIELASMLTFYKMFY